MIRGSIQQEEVTRVNVSAHNARVPGYLKQMLMGLEGDTDVNIIIRGTSIPAFQ